MSGLNALSHITGGGILGNTKRVIPDGLNLNIDWTSWDSLPIFELIQKTGNISDEEMRYVFNIGIGLIAVSSKENADRILEIAKSLNEKAIVIGEVI